MRRCTAACSSRRRRSAGGHCARSRDGACGAARENLGKPLPFRPGLRYLAARPARMETPTMPDIDRRQLLRTAATAAACGFAGPAKPQAADRERVKAENDKEG